MREGAVFEQAGVNFSKFGVPICRPRFWRNVQRQLDKFATGTSMVLHPRNPLRQLSISIIATLKRDLWWFGGSC